MKLSVDPRSVQLNGALATREFTIKAGAHIMAVLSGLYQNPHDAAVREYITNCHDAAVALLAADPTATITPPVVIVPGSLSSELVFADHGIGMDFDTCWNIFCEYGNSTKNDSNDQTGGFGIGAKVWAALAGGVPATIESRKDGLKHIFMAYVSEASIPTMAHVSTTPTTDHSGVTIKLPISREHYETVRTAMRRYVPYYPSPIKVEGMESIAPVSYIMESPKKLWGIRKLVAGEQTGLRAIVGGVPYDYNRYQIPTIENIGLFTNNNVDLYLPVGSVSIVPSRDSLMYTDKTKQAIRGAAQHMMRELRLEVNTRLESAPFEWAAIEQFLAMDKIKCLSDVMGDYAKWNGKKLDVVQGVTRKVTDLQALDSSLAVGVFGIRNAYRARIMNLWDGDEKIEPENRLLRMHPTHHTFIVVNDLNDIPKGERFTKAMLRDKLVSIDSYTGRAHKGGHDVGHAIYVTTTLTNTELSVFFGGYPEDQILMASALKATYEKEKAVREAKKYKDTIYSFSHVRNHAAGGSWNAGVTVPLDVDENGDPNDELRYYLPLQQHGGKRYKYESNVDVSILIKHAEAMGINEGIRLYGIKAEDVSKFDNTIWIHLRDAMDAVALKTATDELASFAAYVNRNNHDVDQGLLEMVETLELDTAVVKTYLESIKTLGTTEYSDAVEAAYEYIYNMNPALKTTIQNMMAGVNLVDVGVLEEAVLKAHPMLNVLVELVKYPYNVAHTIDKHKVAFKKIV